MESILSSLLLIVGFWAGGELLSRVLPLAIPGSVLGLLGLYLALRLGWVRAARVEPGARGLLSVLALLFVPTGAGVSAFAGPIWWPVLGAVIVLTALVIGVTSKLVERLAQP